MPWRPFVACPLSTMSGASKGRAGLCIERIDACVLHADKHAMAANANRQWKIRRAGIADNVCRRSICPPTDQFVRRRSIYPPTDQSVRRRSICPPPFDHAGGFFSKKRLPQKKTKVRAKRKKSTPVSARATMAHVEARGRSRQHQQRPPLARRAVSGQRR